MDTQSNFERNLSMWTIVPLALRIILMLATI